MNDDVTLQGLLRDPKLVVDTVAPTLLFAVLAVLAPLVVAAGAALAWCAVVVLVRRRRKQSLAHAVSGLGGVVIGVAVALLSGDALGFFVPGIVGNLAFGVLCLLSVPVGRPAVAWTSATLVRWPLEWYWHPRVRPAYSEVTIVWGLYYLGKGGWQALLLRDGDLAALATVRLVTGWPGLLALVAATWAYITWRLGTLDAPDVEAFRSGHDEADATGASAGSAEILPEDGEA